MKSYSYFIMMAAALMLMGCAQELTSPEQEHVREVILSAEVVDADAKSAIDNSGVFAIVSILSNKKEARVSRPLYVVFI